MDLAETILGITTFVGSIILFPADGSPASYGGSDMSVTRSYVIRYKCSQRLLAWAAAPSVAAVPGPESTLCRQPLLRRGSQPTADRPCGLVRLSRRGCHPRFLLAVAQR
jgi:hypothetical protein